jgi:hypothetical protein
MYHNQEVGATLEASHKYGPAALGLKGQVGHKEAGGMHYGGMLTLSVDL